MHTFLASNLVEVVSWHGKSLFENHVVLAKILLNLFIANVSKLR
jgi:hypothetical protein